MCLKHVFTKSIHDARNSEALQVILDRIDTIEDDVDEFKLRDRKLAHHNAKISKHNRIQNDALQDIIRGLLAMQAIGQTVCGTGNVDLCSKQSESVTEGHNDSDSEEDEFDDSSSEERGPRPPRYYNARYAMRVLEDYLCIEVLQDKAKPLSFYSLSYLQNCDEYKDAVSAMMTKYDLTKSQLALLRRLKHSAPTNVHTDWSSLVSWTLRVEPDKHSNIDLMSLFLLLANFTGNIDDHKALRSPLNISEQTGSRFCDRAYPS